MWFVGVEIEQETSAPPPKKILDPPLSQGSNPVQPKLFQAFISCIQNRNDCSVDKYFSCTLNIIKPHRLEISKINDNVSKSFL